MHSFGAANGEPAGRLIEWNGALYGTASSGGPFGKGLAFRLTPDGQGGAQLTELHSFTGPDGTQPWAALVRSSDGSFYGTTTGGGVYNRGTIYRLDASGRVTTIHTFDGTDGSDTEAGLVDGGDGFFYGTSRALFGSVFRMDATGQIATIHTFNNSDGFDPGSTLFRASDGAFYGTTRSGGASGKGTIYRVDAAGSFASLHSFDGTDGSTPYGGVVEAADGKLYGVTGEGGDHGFGVVYRIGLAGGGFEALHHLDASEGRLSQASLVRGSDELLYGTTYAGGPNGRGTVFRVDLTGALTTLHPFDGTDGGEPVAELLQASNGKFYGSTRNDGPAGGGTIFEMDTSGGLTTVYSFTPDPQSPTTAVLETPDGSLYGTAHLGGFDGWGAVYRISSDGTFSTVHGFDIHAEGAYADADLVLGSDGNIYGSTTIGSASFGAIFEVDPLGVFSEVHPFAGGAFGENPSGQLVEVAAGSFYGPTAAGGTGFGTVFHMDQGTVTIDQEFTSALGSRPEGRIAASSGTLRGTASAGGANGFGTVWEIDGSNVLTNLFDFDATHGKTPHGGLTAGSDGAFYGTTYNGGAQDHGVVFRIDASNQLSTLHEFDSTDGQFPYGTVIEGSDGELYGTTQMGGTDAAGPGTIFRISKQGDGFETLHSFHETDGRWPTAPLTEASGGGFYGTTYFGGIIGGGVVFRFFTTDTGPSAVAATPSSGPSTGQTAIAVIGTHLRQSSDVTIGGVAASGVIPLDSGLIRAITPGLAPGSLYDVVVTGPDATSATLVNGWFADFQDVPAVHPFHDFVESIVRAGITAGCGGGNYCPDAAVTRAQMAVFLLKAEHGAAYAPPACQGVFADTPCPGPFTDWIEQLAAEGITGGCGGGNYCPASPVTRAQMAIFLLKTLLGSSYTPPPAAGLFGDVPIGSFAADWIEDLYGRQITGGCSSSPLLYCPNNANTRGQMAVFLTKTFSLP